MNELIKINGQSLAVKEYEGKRVVTLKEIDAVHQRPDGTARKRFNDNKQHFIEGEDFFRIDQPSEIRTLGITRPQGGIPESVILITESGYYMLVKSFTDELSWTVQRELVNSYFKVKQLPQMTQMEMIAGIANGCVELEKRQSVLEQRLDNIGEVIALDVNSWRKDTKQLISKIAMKQGGFDYIRDVNAEVYRLVEERAGVQLSTRLTNKRNRMAGEGICKSKRDKLTKVDIIADDKKLIEIYIAIIKEMAVKNGVC
jgi:hypothetical protein